MRLNEAQLRKIIREELSKEIEGIEPKEQEKTQIYPGAIAGGLATGGALSALVYAVGYVQTHPIGHEIAAKIEELSRLIQGAMEE